MPNPEQPHATRILVVEDTALVADLIVEELQDAGYDVVGPVGRVHEALALAESEQLDGALLDVNLGGELCFPIAHVLARRGVAFAFLTGYGESVLPAEYRNLPRLNKPFDINHLVRLARRCFGSPPGSPLSHPGG